MITERFRANGRWVLCIACDSCAARFDRQERVYMKSTNGDLCRSCSGREASTGTPVSAVYSCTGCQSPTSRGYSKCKSCSHKGPEFHCADCGVPITTGALRCLPCHNKKQNKGLSRPRTIFNVSPLWQAARLACFERDNFTCQACQTRGGVLNAHHMLSYRDYPELRLDLSNLTTLCKGCHDAVHGLTKRPSPPKITEVGHAPH